MSGHPQPHDISFVIIHDLAADRQTNTRARIQIPPMQTLKDLEYLLRLPRFETDPIIRYGNL